MADWYVESGASGGGTGAGDKAPGINTFKGSLSNGDRILAYGAAGLIRELVGELTVEDLTIEAADGVMPFWDGSTLVGLSWAVHSDAGDFTVYKSANNTFPVKPSFLYYDWQDGSGSAAGLRIGQVPEDTTSSTVGQANTSLAAAPQWWYDSGNGRIFLSVPNDENPNSGGAIEAAYEMTDNAFKFSGDGVRVLGIGFQRWAACDLGGGNHWTTQFSGIESGYMQGCVAYETGYHPFGSNGGKSHNHLWESCIAAGLVRGTDSAAVAYAGGGEVVRGCEFRDLIVRLGGLRKYDGTPLQSGAALKALAGHSGTGSAIEASGLIYRRPVVIDYADEHALGGTQAFVWADGHGTSPTDRYNASQYPVRVLDGTIAASILGQAQSGGLVAVERTRMNIDGTTSGGISQANYNIASGGETLFESCTLVGEMASGTNNTVVRVSGNVTLSNSSLRAEGVTDGVFFVSSGAGKFHAVHTVFDRENAGYLCKGGGMASPTVSGNVYSDNINTNEFAVPGAFNSQSEWEALDPTGRFGVDLTAEITDTQTLEPDRGGSLWNTRTPGANPNAPTGINGAAYSGTAGAWQKSLGARSRARVRTRRRSAV